MLCIKNLSYAYKKDKYILKNINININSGINILLGKNGSGKTTLIKTLVKILKSKSEILLDEVSINDPTFLDYVSYLPQDFSLYENLKIYEIMELVSSAKGICRNMRNDIINDVLEKTHITDYKNMKFCKCSEGTKRRVGIAVLLIGDYKLYIMDEPTSGLDPVERNNFYNIVKEQMKDKIVIISTHIMDDLISISDNIIMLSNTNITYYGTYSSFIESLNDNLYEIQAVHDNLKSNDILHVISKERKDENYIYHVVIKDINQLNTTQNYICINKILPDVEDVWNYYK